MLQSWVQPGSNFSTDTEDQERITDLFITCIISIQATSASPGNCDIIASAPGHIHEPLDTQITSGTFKYFQFSSLWFQSDYNICIKVADTTM